MEDLPTTRNTRFAAFGRLLLRRRWLFLVGLVLVLGVLTSGLGQLAFDNSPEVFFRDNDPTLAEYQRFKELFETDEFMFVSVEAPEEWTPEFLTAFRSLVDEISELPHVLEVTAITNVRHIEGEAGQLDVEEYLPAAVVSPEAIASRREAATEHPYYKDVFVTADGSHLGILAETEIIEGEIDYKVELATAARELVEQDPYAAWNPRVVGAPVLDADSQAIVSQESGMFGGMVFLLVAIGFFWVFRSVLGVAMPMIIATLAILSTFGILALLGAPLTVLTPIVPSFMISVGVGASIYLMNEIYLAAHRGMELREAIIYGVKTSGLASLMSVATTAGGLLAFASSEVKPVQDIGVAMGLGLLIAYLLTIVLVPIGFSFAKRVKRSEKREKILHDRVESLYSLARFVEAKRRPILVVFTVLLVVAAAGLLRLEVDYYYLGIFSEDIPLRQDYAAVDEEFKGSYSVEVLVQAPTEEGVKEPELLAAVADLQEFIEAEHADLGAKTYSLVDVVREINQALHDGDPAYYRLPDSREEIAQYLLLYELSGDDELEDLVTADYREARVRIGVHNLPFSRYEALFADIDRWVDEEMTDTEVTAAFGEAPEVEITGLVHLWSKIHEYVGTTQMRALLITAAIVLLVMMVMFRSVPIAIVMSVLNLTAVAFTLGMMGWAGVVLDPYTILVASIALGMLDDDSIHLLKHIQWEIEAGRSLEEAIREAFASAGQAMFYMSAVLVVGFAVYALSDIVSLVKFGLLTAFTIVMGAMVEFFLTPAVLLTLRRVLFPEGATESTLTAGEPELASE